MSTNKATATQKLLDFSPSEEVKKLIEFKDAHKRCCLRDFKGYIKAFEGAFEVAVLAIESLNYFPKSHWPNHRGVQYSFFPGMLETLFKAFDDCIDGFYEESTILHRTVFETLLRIIFLSCYPKDFESVYLESKSSKRRKFNVTHLLENDLKLDWKHIWHIGSKMSHGKSHRVLSTVCNIYRGKKQKVSFNLGYNAEKASLPLNHCILFSWCSIRLLLLLFPELLTYEKVPGDYKERLKIAEEALRESLCNMPNKLKDAAKEFERIERIIITAEEGKDWKKVE